MKFGIVYDNEESAGGTPTECPGDLLATALCQEYNLSSPVAVGGSPAATGGSPVLPMAFGCRRSFVHLRCGVVFAEGEEEGGEEEEEGGSEDEGGDGEEYAGAGPLE
jgi:hypothetical protein